MVNYFVSHSNKQLMPFLLDDDYEKVIGWCSLRELWGPSPRLSSPLPDPDTLGSAPSRRASSRPPSLFQATWRRIKRMARVCGWRPRPPAQVMPCPRGRHWVRVGKDLGTSWRHLCPIFYPELQGPRNYPDLAP